MGLSTVTIATQTQRPDFFVRPQFMKFELAPIGVVHSPHRQEKGAPIQPRWAQGTEGAVELFPEFAPGLRDLDGFERIWLLYWFDRAREAQLEVVPYLDTRAHGVFATRAPCRPNPIGISCVRLLAIEGTRLRVAELDILDGTPLLDVKPYVPECDVFDVTRVGWFAKARGSRRADGRFAKGSVAPE
jgi:tRNA (adenine37-N6)-methyltransferase